MKFIIIGLPRSGTTILSNYINSSDKAFCFLEPHWEYTQHQTTNFFSDEKLKRLFFLKYRENESLPLDSAIKRIEKRYEYTGFKETYRSDVYQSYDQNLPNSQLLQRYIDRGYKLIPIARNPLDVWNSLKRHNPSNKGWTADLNDFITCYKDFLNLIGDTHPVIYQHFLKDPIKEISRKVNLQIGPISKLQNRESRMGDTQANKSEMLAPTCHEPSYSDDEKEIILADSLMEQYQQLAKI